MKTAEPLSNDINAADCILKEWADWVRSDKNHIGYSETPLAKMIEVGIVSSGFEELGFPERMERVERVLCGLPPLNLSIIKQWYLTNKPKPVIAARFKVATHTLMELVRSSQLMFIREY